MRRRPRKRTEPPVPTGTEARRAGALRRRSAQRVAARLAMPDLRLAAWFLWMTPLLTALSRALLAVARAVAAASASPASAAVRKRRTDVFRADLTATLRCRARSLVRFRLIWDLMFATREPRCLAEGGVRLTVRPGGERHRTGLQRYQRPPGAPNPRSGDACLTRQARPPRLRGVASARRGPWWPPHRGTMASL